MSEEKTPTAEIAAQVMRIDAEMATLYEDLADFRAKVDKAIKALSKRQSDSEAVARQVLKSLQELKHLQRSMAKTMAQIGADAARSTAIMRQWADTVSLSRMQGGDE